MADKKHLLRRAAYWTLLYAEMIASFFIISTGVVLQVQSGIGVGPWDVLHTGLMRVLPWTLGQVALLTSVVLILLCIPMKVYPYIGTILNFILISVFIDIIYAWGWFQPAITPLWLSAVYLLAGTILFGLGVAAYMATNMKYGPRDGLMIGLCRLTGKRIGVVRTAIEVAVTAVGWLLGGQFGVGTIVIAVTLGWVIEFFVGLVNKVKAGSKFQQFVRSLS